MNKIAHYWIRIIAGTLLLCTVTGVCSAAVDAAVGERWESRENLTRRLSTEWQQTDKLVRDIDAVSDVLAILKDLELYPPEVTNFTDKQLVSYDRELEVLQKKCRHLRAAIDELREPVNDALKIIREMVVDAPVESMFETLESGNLRRINTMLSIKHTIDTLWQNVDLVIDEMYIHFGVPKVNGEQKGPIEEEFFELLKANIGMQSEKYYNRINTLKKHILKYAEASQVQTIEHLDMQRIKTYIKEGNDLLAQRNSNDALECYTGNEELVNDLHALLAGIKLRAGEYNEGLALATLLPKEKKYIRMVMLVRIQCNYALQKYDAVLADTSQNELLSLEGASLNHALWLIVESALKINRSDIGLRYAGYVDKSASFALYVLHALSRVFIASGDDSTALGVVNQGVTMKPLSAQDEQALRELSIMKAELLYELKRYDEALSQFYTLLKAPDMFERSLSGIAWCYLKTDNFKKAEIALRKLINQSPESVAGAEGIYVLAKRNLQGANSAWDKYYTVEKEKKRLNELLRKIERIELNDAAKRNSPEINKAKAYIYELIEKIKSEPLASYGTIASYYQNTEKLCNFIRTHYYTGSFQEVSFSKGRERILSIVDSALAAQEQRSIKKGGQAIGGNRRQKLKVKQLVADASLLSVINELNRYQWEKKYVMWRKNEINKGCKENEVLDSLQVDKCVKSKRSEIDSLILYENEIDVYYSQSLLQSIGGLLQTTLREEDRCYLEYQMAELLYKQENAEYAKKYELYEMAVAEKEKRAKGESVSVPDATPPQLDHKQSMNHYRSAVASNADSVMVGGALYGLGWCFNDMGVFDSAYHYMHYLARNYPENPFTPQAWMYCGEYNFEKGILDTALAAFYRVMKYPESEWFDEALYKVAWTQYRLSNPEKAISSFLALVDLGDGSFGKSLLEKESMDYVAISFSEIDISGQNGLRRAMSFVNKLGDKKRGCEILHRLAQIYKEQGRNDIAQKTYAMILSNYPDYEKNPAVEAEMLMVMERDAPVDVALEQKYAYFKKYNRKGKWALQQSDSVKVAADSVAARMLYDAAVSYHQIALQDNKDTLYARAVSTYRDYISLYKHYPLANECHYNLAEINFSRGNFLEAAEEFMAVSREYPESKYRETAAWNAIVASQNILKREKELNGQEK